MASATRKDVRRSSKEESWNCTSGTIKHIATKLSDVGEALKAVIPAAGNHRRTVSMPIRYTYPGESTDRRLVYAIVTDR